MSDSAWKYFQKLEIRFWLFLHHTTPQEERKEFSLILFKSKNIMRCFNYNFAVKIQMFICNVLTLCLWMC